MKNTFVIGVTGNSGSGKTTFAEIMYNILPNSHSIDADKISRKFLKKDSESYKKIINTFSSNILDTYKNIDMKKLGEEVFRDNLKIQKLNAIMWPLIKENIKEQIDNFDGMFIVDAAMLIESTINELCDMVVCLITSKNKRLERVVNRDYITKNYCLLRFANQTNFNKRMRDINVFIYNDGNLIELETQAMKILEGVENLMRNEKSKASDLKKQLFYTPKHVAKAITEKQNNEAQDFCENYKNFLNICKTERESVDYILEKSKKEGFTEFELGKKYKIGEKFYYNNRNKAIILVTVGQNDLKEGLNILASHIDSPRIDIKGCPLYEDSNLAYFKTHYYGGIKKYQWTTLPLAMHGKIVKKDGTEINLKLGEHVDDPVFCITDLLPHLATEQVKRTLKDAIKGEELNLLVGSMPYITEDAKDNDSDLVKLNVLNLLNECYGIVEQDFITADISMVPASKARDIGFDRGLIGAYGHDDRVCAYASLMAHLESKTPNYTTVSVFVDKEEVGSDGNTGLNSAFLEYFIADLAMAYDVNFRTVLKNSACLSADVNAAYDPTWQDVFEKRNASFANYGTVITKYTGSGGKFDTSDATAEFMHKITSLFDKNNVIWQTGLLGKVDNGGGGTVAKYIAGLNVDVVDIGVAVFSMHAPYEIVSKLDVYMTNRGVYSFINR